MNLMSRERWNRLYNRFMQKNANFLFREILNTPPIYASSENETIFYCALSKSACRQYIAMAKSFLRYTDQVSVVAQDDGSLEQSHLREIKEHLPGSQVYSKDDMLRLIRENARNELFSLIPGEQMYDSQTSVKIMYLKFLNVVFRFNGKKIIIVDSDLLFLRRPDEIIDWVKQPYSQDFYGEGGNARSQDFYDMGFDFKSLDIANFSSGTIGVGGTITPGQLLDIFQRITTYDPELFRAWEIEQALWSVVMSERPNPLNLDSLRDVYIGSGWRSYETLREKAVIAHFAGAVRFNYFRYLRLFNDLVKDLQSMTKKVV